MLPRGSAHVLDEGDELHIPELRPRAESRATGAMHAFRVRQSPLRLRVKAVGEDGKPIAGATITLDRAVLTTDAEGVVEIPVDKTTTSSTLEMSGRTAPLSIGGLDPVDDHTENGWKARLFTLGFLLDPAAPSDGADVAFALRDFQAEHGLPLTGTFDDDTKAKLVEAYGMLIGLRRRSRTPTKQRLQRTTVTTARSIETRSSVSVSST